MRQRDLEILLEQVPPHPRPKPELEQYRTPPLIAADLLFRAQALGDIAGKRVLDLGCGTGMFAIGAALLGASEAVGMDLDTGALEAARLASVRLRAPVRFEEHDVTKGVSHPADTVLQNPPFGAQNKGADRPFLDAALKNGRIVYSLHLTETGDFVIEYAKARGGILTHAWDYDFPIRHQFRFHTKEVQHVPVTAFRFECDVGRLP